MKKYIVILLTVVCIFGLIGCGQQKHLTLDKVVELSSKGDELSWHDFKQYESIETGSGLYILIYDIDENFELIIGGSGRTENPPMYIRLVLKEDIDNYIDIRTDDVEKFIEVNKK